MSGAHSGLGKWLSALVLLVALVLLAQALEYYGWLAGPTGRVLDLLLSHGSAPSGDRPARPVVTVEIDDKAYAKCFSETSPMEPNRIEQLVDLVARTRPPVIGVDILTESQIHTSEYHRMADKFRHRDSEIIWAAGALHAHVEAPGFFAWLRGVKDEIIVDPTRVLGYEPGAPELNPPYWAVPIFPRDDDATIRRLPLEVTLSADVSRPDLGERAPHWVRLIASDYCAWRLRNGRAACPAVGSQDILVSYRGESPFRFNVSDFFQCDPKGIAFKPGFEEAFKRTVPDRVVLIGGTFGDSGDFHESPIGRIPGILVNAYAVQAQVQGGGFYAVDQPWAWVFDLVLGLVFVLAEPATEKFSKSPRLPKWVRERDLLLFGGFVACVLLAVSVGFWKFSTDRYIPGILPIGIGLFLHQFYHAHKVAWETHQTNRKRKPRSSLHGPHPK